MRLIVVEFCFVLLFWSGAWQSLSGCPDVHDFCFCLLFLSNKNVCLHFRSFSLEAEVGPSRRRLRRCSRRSSKSTILFLLAPSTAVAPPEVLRVEGGCSFPFLLHIDRGRSRRCSETPIVQVNGFFFSWCRVVLDRGRSRGESARQCLAGWLLLFFDNFSNILFYFLTSHSGGRSAGEVAPEVLRVTGDHPGWQRLFLAVTPVVEEVLESPGIIRGCPESVVRGCPGGPHYITGELACLAGWLLLFLFQYFF